MAGRVSAIAAPGSLLKGIPVKRKPAKQGIAERDKDYLALVRRLPCVACDRDPAGVAAHVRMTRAGKPMAGTGNKPGDHWTLPLCQACHTEGPHSQHGLGEVRFWNSLGLDPLVICQRLYAAGELEAMRAVVFAERERRK